MKQETLIDHTFTNLLHTILLFGGMIILLILLGFLLAGKSGILWAVVLGFIILILSPNISPKLILRMYNARPLSVDEAPRLYQILNELSRRAEIRYLPQIYYVPSQLMNAFAVGTRDNAAIALTDGLLRNFNRTELIGILAHEISHVRNNDMKVMAVADVISRVTTIFSQVGIMLLFLNFPLLALGKAAISWFAVSLLIFAPTLSSLLQLALSRTREFNADIGAAVISGDPKGLAQALQKLEYYKCSMFERILMPGHKIPDPSLLRSHPKTEERVRRLLSLTEQKDRLLTADRDTIDIVPPGISNIKSSPRWRISGLWY